MSCAVLRCQERPAHVWAVPPDSTGIERAEMALCNKHFEEFSNGKEWYYNDVGSPDHLQFGARTSILTDDDLVARNLQVVVNMSVEDDSSYSSSLGAAPRLIFELRTLGSDDTKFIELLATDDVVASLKNVIPWLGSPDAASD